MLQTRLYKKESYTGANSWNFRPCIINCSDSLDARLSGGADSKIPGMLGSQLSCIFFRAVIGQWSLCHRDSDLSSETVFTEYSDSEQWSKCAFSLKKIISSI